MTAAASPSRYRHMRVWNLKPAARTNAVIDAARGNASTPTKAAPSPEDPLRDPPASLLLAIGRITE